MKIFSYILLLIAIIFGIGYFLLFTQSGNDIIKPYLSSLISQKTAQKVVINKLTLKTDHINTSLNINDSIDINIDGAINLFKKSFDLNYTAKADKIKTKDKTINANINIAGKIEGNIKDIKINGNGEALSSPIDYSLQIVNNEIENINLQTKKAKIEELLAVIGKKEYIKGDFDLLINIPKFNPNSLKGKASLKIYKSILNSQALKEDFKIELPKNSFLQGDVISNLKGNHIETSANIESSFGYIKVKNAKTDISQKEIKIDSDYLILAKLKSLQKIANLPLRGEVKAKGDIHIKGKDFQISAISSSFGGESYLKTDGKRVNINIKEALIEKILYILGENPLSKGKIDLQANINISPLTGEAKIETKEAVLNQALIKKEFKIKLPKDSSYKLSAFIKFLKDKIDLKANLKSFIDMKIYNGIYDLKTQIFKAKYEAYIKDLSTLQPIINKKLKGDMKIEGEITKTKKDLIIDGKSQKFGGNIDFVIKNGKLKLQAKHINVVKILDMALYPKIADGVADIEASYDLISQRGEAFAKIERAKILRNTLTDMIAAFTKYDFTKEKFNETTLKSIINKEHVTFNLLARSEHSYISFKNGKIDTKNETIKAPFDILIKKKDIKGSIEGRINKPKIKINTSKYLKEKAINKVEKLLEKKFGKEGEKNDKIEKIKGILELFKK